MGIEYTEVSVDEVMRYFVKDFKPKAGVITGHEWHYDPHKGTVIFKLYVEDVPADREARPSPSKS